MLTSILQPTSRWSTLLTRCLIRLMLLLRKPKLSPAAQPHDALESLPSKLRQKFSISITRLSLALPSDWSDAKHWNPLLLSPLGHKPTKRTVFYMHGGAFIHMMSPFHWQTVARLSQDLEADVAVQTYTLLPYAGIHDVIHKLVEVYRHVHAEAKKKGHEVIVAGDSAGGCLAASLTLALNDANLPVPDQLLLIAPVLDAELTRPATRALQHRDPWLKIDRLGHVGHFWSVGGSTERDVFLAVTAKKVGEPTKEQREAMRHPYASPILGDWSFYKGHITTICGTSDILLADSLELAAKAEQQQPLDVTFIKAEGCIHVYPILFGLPLARLLSRDSERGFELMVQSVLRKSSV
ncbi:uncharacterized protein PFL1_03316 [Pseudozyma flocculosa PF-1]|uniref:Alpha/beta hydrolase fold-3 domain-containing protein n=2 Tax=Pseudozyma flocculosa TaxID=84751 RepID=A0A5C3F765_9BASI|nr:uncharacterized protein PFL1_03316 [Pseudozyma flocculosa PF-1]EPQ29026.1 hypothetical protein PFL1_03316 [Pseudozyma flocculosa PF-1]SPO40020.1 uncharacterized protein PSFLO_05502 [Pseudozyma flocculosa]